MKRLTILILMLALASCTKEGQFAKARIDFTVSGNTMTKVTAAEIHSAVSDVVKSLPVKIHYGLGGKDLSTCYAGDVVTVPVGNVYVAFEYYGDVQVQDDVFFYTEPYFYADTTVAFHSYYSELVVRAHFKCAMVVVDPSETEDVSLKGEVLDLADYGTFKAFYVFADAEGAKTDVTVCAKEQTDFSEREVTIDPAQLEWGKWYLLSPTGITSKDAEINFDIDELKEGGRI